MENIIDYLMAKNDIYGVLMNCSSNGLITYNFEENLYCACNQYFAGTACETDLKPCSRDPCLNNSTCIDELTDNTFTCLCDHSRYYGKRCEYQIDHCQNETCSNHGTCKEYFNNYKCNCFYLYEGEKCEKEAYKLKLLRKVIKGSMITAIIVIISLYLFTIFIDFSSYYMKNTTKVPKFNKFRRTVRIKYTYIP